MQGPMPAQYSTHTAMLPSPRTVAPWRCDRLATGVYSVSVAGEALGQIERRTAHEWIAPLIVVPGTPHPFPFPTARAAAQALYARWFHATAPTRRAPDVLLTEATTWHDVPRGPVITSADLDTSPRLLAQWNAYGAELLRRMYPPWATPLPSPCALHWEPLRDGYDLRRTFAQVLAAAGVDRAKLAQVAQVAPATITAIEACVRVPTAALRHRLLAPLGLQAEAVRWPELFLPGGTR